MAKKHPQPKYNKKTIVLVSAGIAVALAIVLVLCLVGGGAVNAVQKAARKTLLADNFTAEFSFDINGETTDGFMHVSTDRQAKKLEMYMEFTTRAGDFFGGIYKNKFVVSDAASSDSAIVDITDNVDAFFDALDNGQADWASLLNFDGYDLHGAIDQSFDFDALLSCMEEFLKQLNDTGWAESYAGYSKGLEKGVTKYNFQPDPYVLLSQSLPLFQSAFRNTQDYKDLMTYVDDAKVLLQRGNAAACFGVRRGYLVSADFELQYHNSDIACAVTFTDIGSTVVDNGYVAFIVEEE